MFFSPSTFLPPFYQRVDRRFSLILLKSLLFPCYIQWSCQIVMQEAKYTFIRFVRFVSEKCLMWSHLQPQNSRQPANRFWCRQHCLSVSLAVEGAHAQFNKIVVQFWTYVSDSSRLLSGLTQSRSQSILLKRD